MASRPPNQTNLGSRRFTIRLPSPIWIFVGSMVSIFVGLRLWVANREQADRDDIERLGGSIEMRSRGPDAPADFANLVPSAGHKVSGRIMNLNAQELWGALVEVIDAAGDRKA